MSKLTKINSKRRAISLETKLKILDFLEKGEGPTKVGKRFGLGEGTIRSIKKNESSIRQSANSASKYSSKILSYSRNINLEKMERFLSYWIRDSMKKKIAIDGPSIKIKARQIYEELQKTELGTHSKNTNKSIKFNASSGWLTRFLKRHAFFDKIKGDTRSVDNKAVEEFSQYFQQLIKDGDYNSDQIFNACETGLYWKRMPNRTYIAKSEKSNVGYKASRNRITFLLCSNASGDALLKPLLVNKTCSSRSIRGKSIEQLPVYWMVNKKSWITADIFKKWFHECFIIEVQNYLIQKGLEFKVLLLVDSELSHDISCEYHPNVQLIFCPSNTTALIEPLEQGLTKTFKLYYIKEMFKYILNTTATTKTTSLDVWKKYSILDCINCVSNAIEEIQMSTINVCWKTLWPECVQIDNTETQISMLLYSEIISLAHLIGGEGFHNMKSTDIEEIINDDDDLIEFINDKIDDDKIQPLTSELINEGLKFAKDLENHFLKYDPDFKRALKFKQDLAKSLASYQDLYNEFEKSKSDNTKELIEDFND